MAQEEFVQAQIWERKKLGLEMRQRYELYFVTLIFTLAGLAIQTAKPYSTTCLVWFEIGAWVSLILSGLIGLWRLARLWFREFRVGELFEAEYEPSNRHRDIRQQLNTLDARFDITEVFRWLLFVLGIVA